MTGKAFRTSNLSSGTYVVSCVPWVLGSPKNPVYDSPRRHLYPCVRPGCNYQPWGDLSHGQHHEDGSDNSTGQ